MENLLEVKNLQFSFRTYGGVVKAVRDVSFEVRPGEILALTGAVGETLRQIRAMPEDEQDKMFDAIQKQAEKWHKEAQSAEGRQMLTQIRESEEGRAFNNEVTRMIHSEFTPEERRKFAPITNIWIQTLKLP